MGTKTRLGLRCQGRFDCLLDSLGESNYTPSLSRRACFRGRQMELLQGALHGYGILLRIQQLSEDRLETQQGSLYAARYRWELQGWIACEWARRKQAQGEMLPAHSGGQKQIAN